MRTRAAAIGSTVFFFLGPCLLAGVVPWLLTWWEMRDPTPYWGIARVLGIVLILGGTAVVLHSFWRFVTEGRGTPVPAAAPEHLVIGGLYRYVRNPMYVALLAVILGQALLLGHYAPLVYGLGVWAISAAFVRWREEPVLVKRFGAEYERYRDAVPAWLPRVRPWRGAAA